MSRMLPEFDTVKFTHVWDNVDDFLDDYQHIGIPTTIDVNTSATTLYYLLYARYANNPIANFDITQFKYKLFSIVFQYGPTWEKRLEIQKKLRDLTDDELKVGTTTIYNHAYNPSTEPSTQTTNELPFINDQNVNKFEKSPLDKYAQLWDLLETDVTGEFLTRFQKLFKQFVRPEKPLLYVTEEEEDEE